MTVQIKLLGAWVVGPTPFDGQYVREYRPNPGTDPDGRPMLCHLRTTTDPEKAIQFAGVVEAAELWRAVSTVTPTRPDGRPNRPLTAFTVEMFDYRPKRGPRAPGTPLEPYRPGRALADA